MAVIQRGVAMVLGVRDLKPIQNLPPGATVKIRMRKDNLARAYVRFGDRIEVWTIAAGDETTLSCPTWKLYRLVGVNAAARGWLPMETNVNQWETITKVACKANLYR